jgi:MYXO-CTERM domain-containing protein
MNSRSYLVAALLSLLPAAARADIVAWSYDWGSSTVAVAAGGAGTGGVSLATPTGNAVGTSDIVAANLATFSSALPGSPDTITNVPYNLNVKLTDGASGASGLLSFGGRFSGTLTPTSADISNAFDGPTTKSIQLGDNTYTVTLENYTAPGAPNATTTGSIGAHVAVLADASSPPASPPQSAAATPEPSASVLAGLGLAVLAAVRSRRWKPA